MSKLTIQQVKEQMNSQQLTVADIAKLREDKRVGVQKLLVSYDRKQQKAAAERTRLAQMWKYEQLWQRKGYQGIAGIDEAGRGPLAGPVVAAAVILPADFDVTGIDDSKKLTATEREQLRLRIEQTATGIGVGIVDAAYIDQHNILQSTLHAMRIAVSQLQPQVDCLLVDALRIPQLDLPQQPIVKGDQLSHSIAAASIIAKTTRDALMEEAEQKYQHYAFSGHKGYGTAEHLAEIKQWGPSPIHRRSFAPLQEWFPQVR